MPNPWEAEIEVDAALAGRLVADQFEALAGLPVRALGQGWDNAGFRVGEAWVFRFPRRAIAAPLLVTEAEVLPALAPHLPLAIPVPAFVGAPALGYPWHFSGYRYLEGRTIDEAGLDDDDRALLAADLGRFLRRLHALEVPGIAFPEDQLFRFDLTRRLPVTFERLGRLVDAGVVTDAGPVRAVLEGPVPEPEGPRRICHGDLYARHLLVDEAGRLSAVIDWGDVHQGDPAVDLGVAMSVLPPAARRAFFGAYGAVSQTHRVRARVRAVQHSVAVCAYAHDIGDVVLLAEGRGALDRAVR